MYLIVFRQLITMTLIAVGSFFFSKAKKCGEIEQRFLSNLLLFFIMPCVIINALDIEFEYGKFIQFICLIFMFLIAQLIFVAVAALTIHPKTDLQKQRRSADIMAIVYSNVGFIGIPLINAMFGAEGVFLMIGCNVTFNIFVWTHGIYTVTHKITPKQIFLNPAIVSVIIAIVLFVTPLELYKIVSQTLEFISHLNTGITMILLGMLFATYHSDEEKNSSHKFRAVFHIAKIVMLRLVISPSVLLLVCWLTKNFLSFIPNLKQVMIILIVASSSPIGMNVANFAVLYNPKNKSYTSLLVLVSSMLCIVTIPLIIKIAEEIL